MRKFTRLPFTACHSNGSCGESAGDYSNWLAAGYSEADEGAEIPEQNIEQFVSRCSACEVEGALLTLHSQTTELPDCPSSWDTFWTGYSFLSVGV